MVLHEGDDGDGQAELGHQPLHLLDGSLLGRESRTTMVYLVKEMGVRLLTGRRAKRADVRHAESGKGNKWE